MARRSSGVAMFDLGEAVAAGAAAEVLCAVEQAPAAFDGRGSLAARLALRVHRYSRRLATAYAMLSPQPRLAGPDGLSDAQREVIVLAVAGRIAYRDIADVLNLDARWSPPRCGPGSSRSRTVRSLRQDRMGSRECQAGYRVEPGGLLREALRRRAVMDQAKGLLMGQHGCDADAPRSYGCRLPNSTRSECTTSPARLLPWRRESVKPPPRWTSNPDSGRGSRLTGKPVDTVGVKSGTPGPLE